MRKTLVTDLSAGVLFAAAVVLPATAATAATAATDEATLSVLHAVPESRDVTVCCESCSHVLVSTTSDGSVRTPTTAGATADQKAADRKLTRIVRQIAAGTTVPRQEGQPA